MVVPVNSNKKWVFIGRCLTHFYNVIKQYHKGEARSLKAEVKCYKRFKYKNTKTLLLRYQTQLSTDKNFDLHIFFNISNLVAKTPDLNLGKKLSNLLSNHEVLN